jgi:adenosine deaminase
VGLVVAASRLRHPLDARALARLAASLAGDGPGEVVGFGLNNDEKRGDTAAFAPAFAIARRAGLASVPHGGELLGATHVRHVARELRPDRIGHGVRASEDPAVLAQLVRDGVTFEVCPLSNVALGVYDAPGSVPLRPLLEAGAQVALGADDPLIFGSRLVDQYASARHDHGLTDPQLAELAAMSIRASRSPDGLKARLLRGVQAWLDAPDPAPGPGA